MTTQSKDLKCNSLSHIISENLENKPNFTEFHVTLFSFSFSIDLVHHQTGFRSMLCAGDQLIKYD